MEASVVEMTAYGHDLYYLPPGKMGLPLAVVVDPRDMGVAAAGRQALASRAEALDRPGAEERSALLELGRRRAELKEARLQAEEWKQGSVAARVAARQALEKGEDATGHEDEAERWAANAQRFKARTPILEKAVAAALARVR